MRAALLLGLLGLAACGPRPPMTPEAAAAYCEGRARAAAGPTGAIAVGVNNRTGFESGISVGLSSDYLAGRDPAAVYVACMQDRTGAIPAAVPAF
ncbi:hypothetical protein [Wenxinia saemankumensis]|uniref:Lipoprotein n=1 Tax=Wenxinia saemankumensis TaxID=1447782 RepID=A0A1M6EN03_9RHOB|nr:hypothetical protein [Wenxinia saemankumensis]SHI86882.1 hypothetical protein SAMN05444417_2083 [Wenxinia saemankumensis]